jgi:hypothetical protein
MGFSLMAKDSEKGLEATKALMGALLRQPPKHHDEMKVGKKAKKAAKKRRRPQRTVSK